MTECKPPRKNQAVTSLLKVEPRQKSRRHIRPMSSHRETQRPSRPLSLSERSNHVSLVKDVSQFGDVQSSKKTPTQRAKIIAEHKLCFSCLNDEHSFRKCPMPRKCTKEGCTSSHNTLLHGAERIFPSQPKPVEQTQSLTKSSVPTSEPSTQKPQDNNSSLNSVTLASKSDVKGLLQIVKVNLSSSYDSHTAWALCDSACSHSWMTRKLARI